MDEYNIDDILKMDLTDSGITKRNPVKLEKLKAKAAELRKYFKPSGTEVKLIINTGFNSLGFISISGKSIHVFDKEIMQMIKEDAAYVNIIFDDPERITFEIGYVNLCK